MITSLVVEEYFTLRDRDIIIETMRIEFLLMEKLKQEFLKQDWRNT